jgi:long-subunit fatty acid transport protein
MTKVFQTVVALALVGGASTLSAQGVLLQGADPVTIGRSGAEVAYGRSLEAAGLNPALLPTLAEPRSAHVALGLEIQAGGTTAQSDLFKFTTSDRNRVLTAFGYAQRLNDRMTWGLKLDQPFGRHTELRGLAPTRFSGDAFSLSAHRLEAQFGWTLAGRPDVSFGVGLGVTRLGLELGNRIRVGVPVDPTQPSGPLNPIQGLAELSLREEGQGISPSLTLGARWALSSRWTVAATFESPLKAKPSLSARYLPSPITVWDNNGFGVPPIGTDARAYQLIGTSDAVAGSGDVKLPARATLGVRQRQSQLLTWEVDLQWMGGGFQVPTFAGLRTLSGTTSAPTTLETGGSSWTLKAMGEFTLSREWVLRLGLGLATGYGDSNRIEPMLGGAAQSFYSAGFGYKVFGGELSFGYQARIDRDSDTPGLQGAWDVNGYRSVPSKVRVEGEGHLLSLGFRKAF